MDGVVKPNRYHGFADKAKSLFAHYWVCILVFGLFYYLRYAAPLLYDQLNSNMAYRDFGGLDNYLTGYLVDWVIFINGRLVPTLLGGMLEVTKFTSDVTSALLMSVIVGLFIHFFNPHNNQVLNVFAGSLFFLLERRIYAEIYNYASLLYMAPVVLVLLCIYLLQPVVTQGRPLAKNRRILLYVLISCAAFWLEPVSAGFFCTLLAAVIYVKVKYKTIDVALLISFCIATLGLLSFVMARFSIIDVSPAIYQSHMASTLLYRMHNIFSTIFNENALVTFFLFLFGFLFVWQRFDKQGRQGIWRRVYLVVLAVIGLLYLLIAYTTMVDWMHAQTIDWWYFSGSTVLPYIGGGNGDAFRELFDFQMLWPLWRQVVALLFPLLTVVALFSLLRKMPNSTTLLGVYLMAAGAAAPMLVASLYPLQARHVSFSTFLMCILCYALAGQVVPMVSAKRGKWMLVFAVLLLYLTSEQIVLRYTKINQVRLLNDEMAHEAALRQIEGDWDYKKDILYQMPYEKEWGLFYFWDIENDPHVPFFLRIHDLDENTIVRHLDIGDEAD